jgi:hypothetical protein
MRSARELAQITEADWVGWVKSTAVLHGWSVFDSTDVQRANAGWPGLVFVRDDQMVIAKLKAERGQLTQAQQSWIDDLSKVAAASGGAVLVCVWRPSDESEVQDVLR